MVNLADLLNDLIESAWANGPHHETTEIARQRIVDYFHDLVDPKIDGDK